MKIETKAGIATGLTALVVTTLIGGFIMYPNQTDILLVLGLVLGLGVIYILVVILYLEFKDYFKKKQDAKRKISIAPKGWNKE
jgi:hypothetical protein